MTPLTQQLEDKKKELKELHEEKTAIEDCYESNTRLNEDWDYSQILKRMEILKKEIAILEQAIAEMQKQKQEILEQIGYKLFSEDEQKSNNVWYKKGWNDNASRINKELQQLNQPKTEK